MHLCFLIIFHFAVPFFLLLMRAVKRNVPYLGVIAIIRPVASLVDDILAGDARVQSGWAAPALDGFVGHIWDWRDLGGCIPDESKARPLLPLHDPRMNKWRRERWTMDIEKPVQDIAPGPGYETSDANPLSLLLFGLGMFAIIVSGAADCV